MNAEVKDQSPAEPVFLNISLTVDQINAVIGSLGKLPTESGVWMLRQYIINQAQAQIDELPQTEEPKSE